MTFPRQFPLGVPFRAQLTSAIGTNWDIFISEAVDGPAGGASAGPIVLTNTTLGGTSSVNTSGTVQCTNITALGTLSVTGATTLTALATCNGGATIAGTMHCTGQATFDNDARASLGCVEGKVVIADKMQPRAVNEQTIDCAGGAAAVTLNLTLFDNFLIHLFDSGGPTITAVLHQILLTTVTANTDLQIKKGSKFRIVFDCPGQSGGLGLDFSPWPVSVVGYTKSDCLGPRSGDATGTGGGNDFMIWELENIGAVGSPEFLAKLLVMGGAL